MNDRYVRFTARVAVQEGKQRHATHCLVPECKLLTSHGKPYCLKHLHRLQYVREILDRLEAQRDEVNRVARGGHGQVNVHGIIAMDLLAHVEQREVLQFGSLVREPGLGAQVSKTFEQALVEAGLLERERVGRRRRLQVMPAGRELLNLGSPDQRALVPAQTGR